MPIKLIAFDMDSTLIACETLDRFAKMRGVEADVSDLTARAMRGEFDFKTSLHKRAELLQGLTLTEVARVLDSIPWVDGAEELIQYLHQKRIRVALVTGGPQVVAEPVGKRLGIQEIVCCRFEFDSSGVFTGRVLPPIVDAAFKAQALRDIAQRHSIPLAETAAVGDGANDIEMIRAAGIGVAFHAKAALKSHAKHTIDRGSLMQLVPLLNL